MESGYGSLEEQMQEYVEVFLGLQQEQSPAFFAEKKALLEERERETKRFLPAVLLRERYFLTEAEYWIMMFAFCCELEDGLCLDFRRKYKENRPDMQYILHLLSAVLPIGFADVAGFFRQGGALGELFAWGEEETGLMQRPLSLNSTVFYFLLTGDLPREDWYTLYGPEEEEGMPGEGELLPLHEREYHRLRRYLCEKESLRILLYGGRGSGSRTLIRRACREMGTYALFIRTKEALCASASRRLYICQTLQLIRRILPTVTVAELPEEVSGSSREEWENVWKQLFPCQESGRLCILARTRVQEELVKEETDVRILLKDALSREEKRLALEAWLPPQDRKEWQEELVEPYKMNIGEWRQRQKKIIMQTRGEAGSLTERKVWLEAMREKQEVLRFGRLIEESVGMEDIILPGECRKQLETVIRLAKAWRGEKGMQLLFYGTSGTGKTMAASVLAGELGFSLLKVDLSQVFDKYIGETEKHIDEIFRMARRGNYLLFFDEADALFTKRTAVRDSHDRYANVSASFLLQRMEEYEGILILATNLRDHFDDAFVRRIRFAVKFRNLDQAGRERLWRKALEGIPVAPEVDFGVLAEAAELSPARISAAVHVAKLLAACDGSGAVAGEHLKEALALEAGKDETAIKGF